MEYHQDVDMEEHDENGDQTSPLPIVMPQDSDESLNSPNPAFQYDRLATGSGQDVMDEGEDEDEEESEDSGLIQDENAPEALNLAVETTPVDLPTKTNLKIRVNKLHVSAEWKWTQSGDDNCGICRMAFEACCVDCVIPGDTCPLVIGQCKHRFHLHCIMKWTDAQSTAKAQCPLCRQEWKYAD